MTRKNTGNKKATEKVVRCKEIYRKPLAPKIPRSDYLGNIAGGLHTDSGHMAEE